MSPWQGSLDIKIIKYENKWFVLTPEMKPTPEQVIMIKQAAQRPIVYDEDCPKSTPERLKRFITYGQNRKRLKEG